MIIKNYKTQIICNDYVNVGNSISVTIRVTDDNNNRVVGEPIELVIVYPDGTRSTSYSGTTTDSDYTITYTPSQHGLYTLECGYARKQFYVGGWATYSLSSVCTLYYNETEVIMKVSGTVTYKNGAYITNWTIPSTYSFLRPSQKVIVSGHMSGAWQIYTTGEIRYKILSGSTTANATGNIYVEAYWARSDMQ